MIESILPRGVRSAEVFEDAVHPLLSAEEERLIANAVGARRLEFATGRACARRALRRIGVPPVSIGSGLHGEPLWPVGVVGSITHCRGYRAAAVARSSSIPSFGIDAEPAAALPEGLIAAIANPGELRQIAALARDDHTIPWDRLIFSIKEAAYKAWFPLTEHSLGPKGIQVRIEPDASTFLASVRPRGRDQSSPRERVVRRFRGRWTIDAGLLITVASPLLAPAPGEGGGLRVR